MTPNSNLKSKDETSDEVEEESILELPPINVKITNPPTKQEPKNPTSEDTEFIESYMPTVQEIKEMTDAQ